MERAPAGAEAPDSQERPEALAPPRSRTVPGVEPEGQVPARARAPLQVASNWQYFRRRLHRQLLKKS